jgi:hypothetical protein
MHDIIADTGKAYLLHITQLRPTAINFSKIPPRRVGDLFGVRRQKMSARSHRNFGVSDDDDDDNRSSLPVGTSMIGYSVVRSSLQTRQFKYRYVL